MANPATQLALLLGAAVVAFGGGVAFTRMAAPEPADHQGGPAVPDDPAPPPPPDPTPSNPGGAAPQGAGARPQPTVIDGDVRWHRARQRSTSAAASDPFDVPPYLRGVTAAPERQDVTIYDPDRALPGVNLVVSGHAAEASLIDMKGEVIHTWARPFDTVWPGPIGPREIRKTHWRRVHLFPNGDLLAIFTIFGVIKIDRDSNLLWKYRGTCHHDLFVTDDGRIFTLSRRVRRDRDAWIRRNVIDDLITELSPDGRLVRQTSLINALLRSPYGVLLSRCPRDTRDVLHTNTIQILDGAHADTAPMFAAGRALVSMRALDTVAVVDLAKSTVTWAMGSLWHKQHEPVLVDGGRLLLFDNRGHQGTARAIEVDPRTHEVVWEYHGTAETPLISEGLGTVQRLANGNTLITESESGRALEVTPDGDVVWEYLNPHRAGEDNELIASLFEVVRFDWDALDLPAIRERRAAGVETKRLEELTRGIGK
ncbi:MAG: arylsulfotransferase family protein [Planctomycetota bacterium]